MLFSFSTFRSSAVFCNSDFSSPISFWWESLTSLLVFNSAVWSSICSQACSRDFSMLLMVALRPSNFSFYYFVAKAIHICLELLYFVLQSVTQGLDWIDDLFQDTIKGNVMVISDLVFLACWRCRHLEFLWVGRRWAIREGSFCCFLFLFLFIKGKAFTDFWSFRLIWETSFFESRIIQLYSRSSYKRDDPPLSRSRTFIIGVKSTKSFRHSKFSKRN